MGTPRLSIGVEVSILFSSRDPIPSHRAVGIQKWAVYVLCSSKSGDAVFLAVLESCVALERPVLNYYCHRLFYFSLKHLRASCRDLW